MTLPEKPTWLASVTAMVATTASFNDRRIRILPLPAFTASLKVRTILLLPETAVALSAGFVLSRVGATVSAIVTVLVTAALEAVPSFRSQLMVRDVLVP